MKKTYLKFIPFLLAGGVLLSSCNKEDDVKKADPVTEHPSDFSDKTVAENKAELEKNGLEMINIMTELKNTAGAKTSIAFTHFQSVESESEIESGMRRAPGASFMKSLTDFAEGKTSADAMLAGMRTSEDEANSLQEFYDNSKGAYTWNSALEDWDIEEGGDKIVFKFPSTKTGTSNNASFSIFNYKGKTGSNPLLDDYAGDFPESLNAELVVDGKKEIEYSIAAKYNANSEPTSVTTTLAIHPFVLTVSVSNTVKEVKADYSLKKADKTLIAFGGKANGNFDSNNMNNSEDASDVIETSSAYFQVLNIKLTGDVNVKAIDAELGEEPTVDEEIAALNKNYKLALSYVDSNKMIADTKFYKDEDGDASIRFIFADDSKADVRTYFGEGFDKVEDKFFDFTEDLESDVN